jgi:hypothetical protein
MHPHEAVSAWAVLRAGSTLRPAGHHLKLQRSAKKLLIVITDGEPFDTDVRDPLYLATTPRKQSKNSPNTASQPAA